MIKPGTINSVLSPSCALAGLLKCFYILITTGFYILAKAYCDQYKPLKDPSGIAYDLGAQVSGKMKLHETST